MGERRRRRKRKQNEDMKRILKKEYLAVMVGMKNRFLSAAAGKICMRSNGKSCMLLVCVCVCVCVCVVSGHTNQVIRFEPLNERKASVSNKHLEGSAYSSCRQILPDSFRNGV